MSPARHTISGHVDRGFESVGDVFIENFRRRGELGGGVCAYWRGDKVIDLWEGLRSKATGEPWEQDTMVIVYSATKGLAAATLAIAHSRGWLDYDERVSTYWAGVRAAGARSTSRPAAAGPSSGSVRTRRTNHPQPGRGSRSPRRRSRTAEAGVEGWHASGVPRDYARLLRE